MSRDPQSGGSGEPHVHAWLRDYSQPTIDTSPPLYSWQCSCGSHYRGAVAPKRKGPFPLVSHGRLIFGEFLRRPKRVHAFENFPGWPLDMCSAMVIRGGETSHCDFPPEDEIHNG